MLWLVASYPSWMRGSMMNIQVHDQFSHAMVVAAETPELAKRVAFEYGLYMPAGCVVTVAPVMEN